MKEFATHLLALNAPVMVPVFGFFQQHLEFPRGLPSQNYLVPMLLSFSVQNFPDGKRIILFVKAILEENGGKLSYCRIQAK